MKLCECENEMVLSKYGYQYIWECENCQATEIVDEDEDLEGEF